MLFQAVASRSFLAWYNARLSTNPYSTRALGTGVTYFFADLTAQAIEHNDDVSPIERAQRAAKFGAVGAFWVGPLLTCWFAKMDRVVPGKSPKAVLVKMLADQLLQGPFMIGSMFIWCSVLNGASLAAIKQKLAAEHYNAWVNSLFVWGPVQVFQQAVVPLQYRVLVANGVSYFWDTWLSLRMMPSVQPEDKASEESGVASTSPSRSPSVTNTVAWEMNSSQGGQEGVHSPPVVLNENSRIGSIQRSDNNDHTQYLPFDANGGAPVAKRNGGTSVRLASPLEIQR